MAASNLQCLVSIFLHSATHFVQSLRSSDMGLPALFAGCACSMRFCDIKRLFLCISQGLVFGDESLLVDDTCTNSEEGDCSLSLRQLRLHKAQEQAESVHSEPQSIEPVSFVLPCTEPSELEGVQLSEMKAEEEKEEKEQEEMDEFAKYRVMIVSSSMSTGEKRTMPSQCRAPIGHGNPVHSTAKSCVPR